MSSLSSIPINKSEYSIFDYFDDLFKLSELPYPQLLNIKDEFIEFYLEFDKFILELNLDNQRNKAFIYLLFDISERLQLRHILYQLNNCIKSQATFKLGSRLRAALIYSTKTGGDNSLYIHYFDDICSLLETAIREEDDDEKKSLATFANYYLSVLDIHKQWIKQLRLKIKESQNQYAFLSSDFINKILECDINNPTICWDNIQELKDQLLCRKNNSFNRKHNFIIESNTNYANYINSLHDISFHNLRNYATKYANNVLLEHRGVKPLTSEEEMFSYTKSYGNMHYAKIKEAIEFFPWEKIGWKGACHTPLVLNSIDIIDWGCGQGIATFTLLKETSVFAVGDDINLTLIEPSEIALKRASLHSSIFQIQCINTICSDFDNLTINDLQNESHRIKIHLFSNVLDMENFSLQKIEHLIEKAYHGYNYFICVSPYINDFKSERVNSFMDYFKKYTTFVSYIHLENSKSSDDYWNCNNNFMNRKCVNHATNGCKHKWTRIINVFSVDL